jgi:adenine-specific DNA-methyltransferase
MFTDRGDMVLDFFAGTGTTAAVAQKMQRNWIAVEMAEEIAERMKTRMMNVLAGHKSGIQPLEGQGNAGCFQFVRLEAYEDTLNNLELKRTEARQSFLEQHRAFREDYMLHYMLDVESRESASLLNLDRFEDPFNYTLNIATGTVGETKPKVVDLVETFNYLIGLRVKTIDHIGGVRVVTGLSPQGERVLILWRKTKEMDNDALDAWFRKQGYNTKDQEYDVIYVNGDNNLENLKKPDQTWKVRIIEEEFLRRMFDVQDV